MIRGLRTAAVIARRDFHATVVSRTFLLFLLAPLFPIIFGVVFGAVGANVDDKPGHGATKVIAISAEPATMALLSATHDRLKAATPSPSAFTLEPIELLLPDGRSARVLLKERKDIATLLVISGQDATLYGDSGAIERVAPYATLLLAEADRDRALRRAGFHDRSAPRLATAPFTAPTDKSDSHSTLGSVSQTVLFVLTLMLAGVLLSNFIEEKGNKVIEVLAAAAPVPAIFTGKLFAMLGSSLVGVAVWGLAAILGLVLFFPPGFAALPVPAVGWPAFVLLGVLYFSTNYLLVGALLLGIGAQAASVRQIQTISLPITMGQLLLYGLAGAAFSQSSSVIALIAAAFPYSSPLTMIAYAARMPALWPHFAALAWQMLWVTITIAVTARWFKRGVLQSGPVRAPSPRRRTKPPAPRFALDKRGTE